MPRLPAELVPIFERYVRGPTIIRQALDGVGPTAISRPGPGGWSIRDVVVHLSDAELVRAIRFRLILVADDPPLFDFDEGLWKRRLQYLWRSPEAALALFEQTVFTSAELLRQCEAAAWGRAGVHPTDGPLTVTRLLERGADHVEEHAAQVRDLRVH